MSCCRQTDTFVRFEAVMPKHFWCIGHQAMEFMYPHLWQNVHSFFMRFLEATTKINYDLLKYEVRSFIGRRVEKKISEFCLVLFFFLMKISHLRKYLNFFDVVLVRCSADIPPNTHRVGQSGQCANAHIHGNLPCYQQKLPKTNRRHNRDSISARLQSVLVMLLVNGWPHRNDVAISCTHHTNTMALAYAITFCQWRHWENFVNRHRYMFVCVWISWKA